MLRTRLYMCLKCPALSRQRARLTIEHAQGSDQTEGCVSVLFISSASLFQVDENRQISIFSSITEVNY